MEENEILNKKLKMISKALDMPNPYFMYNNVKIKQLYFQFLLNQVKSTYNIIPEIQEQFNKISNAASIVVDDDFAIYNRDGKQYESIKDWLDALVKEIEDDILLINSSRDLFSENLFFSKNCDISETSFISYNVAFKRRAYDIFISASKNILNDLTNKIMKKYETLAKECNQYKDKNIIYNIARHFYVSFYSTYMSAGFPLLLLAYMPNDEVLPLLKTYAEQLEPLILEKLNEADEKETNRRELENAGGTGHLETYRSGSNLNYAWIKKSQVTSYEYDIQEAMHGHSPYKITFKSKDGYSIVVSGDVKVRNAGTDSCKCTLKPNVDTDYYIDNNGHKTLIKDFYYKNVAWNIHEALKKYFIKEANEAAK